MDNVLSRITLACALVLLVQQASAETKLERSNRILGEIDARVVDARKGSAVCAFSSAGYSRQDLRGLAKDLAEKIRTKCRFE